jgi:hypothetical protein
MSDPRITYTPHPDATVQRERSVLGAIYALVLTAKEKAVSPTRTTPKT